MLNNVSMTCELDSTFALPLDAVHQLTHKQSYINASDLETESGPIINGQGEYIIFRSNNKPVDRSTFEKAYEIFVSNAPEQIANQSDLPEDEYADRYKKIKKQIKKIDSSLEIAFIPRTLYELTYIIRCIKEDLKTKSICDVINSSLHNVALGGDKEKINECIRNIKQKRECWHALPFMNVNPNNKLLGGDPDIVYRKDIIDIAHRLNNKIASKLSPKPEGFTYDELAKYVDNAIDYLKGYYNKTDNKKICIETNNGVGPTTYFASNKLFNSGLNSMEISKDHQVQMIKNALKADCSKEAQTSILLYRGAKINEDKAYVQKTNQVYSLSFGTSLFAGCVWDPVATPFRYFYDSNNAFIIPVRLKDLKSKSTPFYVPPTNTIAQLLGKGESFHARTLAWKGFDLNEIYMGSLCGLGGNVREHLSSEIPEQELKSRFEDCKMKAILLLTENKDEEITDEEIIADDNANNPCKCIVM